MVVQIHALLLLSFILFIESTRNVSFQNPTRPGVVVLGMHRSGTSLMSGLLYGMNMHLGGPVIGASSDNIRGHFERVDVVLQNDLILAAQGLSHDASDLYKFDYLSALKLILDEIDFGSHFFEGRRALRYYNEPANIPWLLKDPRMCITLRTWLPLFTTMPAAVFIYRDPMSVALSLMNRNPNKYTIQQALELWYVYNMRAIQQSVDLCRVIVSYKELMLYPEDTVARIHRQVTLCGVHNLQQIAPVDIAEFMIYRKFDDFDCGLVATEQGMSIGFDLNSLDLPDEWQAVEGRSVGSDLMLYISVMRLYCAMESDEAFSPGYDFDLNSVVATTQYGKGLLGI